MTSEVMKNMMSSDMLTMAVQILLPLMALTFVFGIAARWLIYFTVGRHEWFAREFEKRVNRFIEKEVPGEKTNTSFYLMTKKLLEKTYYEVFEIRERMKRRRNDKILTTGDRIFLIKPGCAWLVRDILKQLKFLRWHDNNPKLINITKNTFQQNPCFNKVFGLVPIGTLNDFVNILPGLFVIGGIFGTFLGIVNGLPKLGGMSLDDVERSKQVMDGFLFEVSFAMNSSIMGILFSVLMTVFNTLTSPEKLFVSMVDRFENSLDLLWYRSNNNDFPLGEDKFDENRDPSEVLAAESLQAELSKTGRKRDLDEVRKTKAS